MSNTVDNRVVEMQFDNKNFEKNVSTSMNTIDKLKKSLNFSDAGKGLDNLQRSVDSFSMAGIQESLIAIQDRFSTMGIVGMTVIQNLTNFALRTLGNISSKIGNLIVQGGISRAMNIENAKFQLEGLGIKYNEVFRSIDYAVTNTAYGLDAAAQAAAQLSAAGLDYKNVIFTHEKDNEELTQMSMALRAVSGVAAQTQTDYSMVARYFQDVANAGKVTGATLTYMTQVLNLPVEQNLAEGLKAIADGSMEASESVKNAVKSMVKDTEVSAEQVRDYVGKGLISFDVFSTIMFGKYADHAVDANRTIMGVMSNIRAAFSKIGAEFVQPIIEIDGAVVKMLDAIRAKVNAIKPMIIPFAKDLTGSIKIFAELLRSGIEKANLEWMKPFFEGLGKVIKGVTEDIVAIKYAFSAIFPKDTTNSLLAFSEKFKEFGKNFLNTQQSMAHKEEFQSRLQGLFSLLSAGKTILQAFLSPFKGFFETIFEYKYLLADFIDVFADWAKHLDETLKKSEKLKEISSRLYEFGSYIAKSLSRLGVSIGLAIRDIKNSDKPLTTFAENLGQIVGRIGTSIIHLIEILTGKDLTKVKEFWSSISDFLTKVLTTLTNSAESLKDKFGNILGQFVDNLKKFKIDLSPLGDFVENITKDKKPIEGVFSFLSSVLTGFLTLLSNVIPEIVGLGKSVIEPIKKLFTSLFDALKGNGNSNLDKAINNTTLGIVLYQLKNVYIQINKLVGKGNPLKGINDFVSQLKDTAFQFEKNLNGQYWLKIAGSILMIALAMKMISDIDQDRLAEATAVVLLLLRSMAQIGKFLSGNSNTILDNKWMQKAVNNSFPSFIAIAAAVYILAGALKKVASVPEDRLLAATAVIEVLLLSMAMIGKLLANNSNTILDNKWIQKAANNTFPNFIAFAAAIYILALAVKKIADIPEESLLNAVLVVEILMATMAIIAKVLSSGEGKGKSGLSALQMVGMAVGVLILAKAVESISNIPQDKLWQSVAVIEILLVTMGALAKLMSTGNNMDSGKMVALGVGMIAIAAAMKIFASAAADFAELNWEELGKAGAAMAVIIGLIALFSKLTASSSGFGSTSDGLFGGATKMQNMVALGVGMIAIAAAMKIFASAAEDFASLSWGELGKAGVALAGLMVTLGAFAHFTSGGELLAISGAMMIFAVALLVLVPAIEAFGHLQIGQVVVALLAVAGVIATLAIAAKLTQGIQISMLTLSATLLLFGAALAAVGGGLLAFSAGITATAGTLVLIVKFIIELVKAIVIGVIQVITESSAELAEALMTLIESVLLSLKDHIPTIVDAVFDIIIQVINILASRLPELVGAINNLVGGLVDAFKVALGDINPEDFLVTIAGIVLFLAAVAAAAFIVQKAMIGVLGITVVMVAIAALFVVLKMIGYDADQILTISEGLSLILLSLSGAMLLLALIPVPAALSAIGSLAIIIAGLIAILAALGGLAQIPGFEWLMGEGTRVLGEIGNAIGTFVGSIVGGFGAAVSSSLPEIADNLSQFALHLVPFISTMKLVDAKLLLATGALAGVILALTAADLINGVVSFVTGGTDFSVFGDQLSAFAPALVDFYNITKDVDVDRVKSAAEAALALANMMNKMPKEGGVVGWFMGETDMSKLSAGLRTFARAMVDYGNIIKDLDSEAVLKSMDAANAVSALADGLPNEGGVVGWFMGENSMGAFAEQLPMFAVHLVQYSHIMRDMDTEAVAKTTAAAQALTTLAEDIPNEGGAVSWFTGDNDMKAFGMQLYYFGWYFAKYAEEIAKVDLVVVGNTTAASKSLVELSNMISNSGGISSWFTGDNDFKTFGKSLVSFGESMRAFSESISGIVLDGLDDLLNGVKKLIEVAALITDIDTERMGEFGKNANKFIEKFGSVGKDYVSQFVNQFVSDDAVGMITTNVNAFLTNILNALGSKAQDFFNKGVEMIKKFIMGMQSKTGDAKSTAEGVAKAAINGLGGLEKQFYTIGVNCITGLTNGLNDKDAIDALIKRIYLLASQIEAAATGPGGADSHSPSRKTQKLGKYLVEGLALGIKDNAYLAIDESESLASETINNMQTAINAVRDSIDEDMDIVPVITPVVDLTNVNANASRINDLFNRSIVGSNVRAAVIPRNLDDITNLQNGQLDLTSQTSRFGTTFIQNNYSPKALNRMEIYRQTRNQFAQYREAMQ